MGYVSTKTGPLNISSGRVLMLQQRAGLGDLTTTITDALPDAYSDTSTITGLPVIYELAFAALGAIVLWSITRRGGRAVRKRAKRAATRVARIL